MTTSPSEQPAAHNHATAEPKPSPPASTIPPQPAAPPFGSIGARWRQLPARRRTIAMVIAGLLLSALVAVLLRPSSPPNTLGAEQMLPVEVVSVRYQLLSAQDYGANLDLHGHFPAKTTGRFLVLRLTLTNLTNDAVRLFAEEFRVSDGRRTFHPSAEPDVLLNVPDAEECVIESLPAGIARTCTFIYEIPSDARGLRFAAHDVVDKQEMVLIGLGQ